MEGKVDETTEKVLSVDRPKTPDSGGPINASGHRQELDRNFRLINICGLGITTGNTWIALGGSLVGAFYPFDASRFSLMFYFRPSRSIMEVLRVLYTNCMFSSPRNILAPNIISIAASVFYWLIAASIAELASAMPSSGGGSYSQVFRCICSS